MRRFAIAFAIMLGACGGDVGVLDDGGADAPPDGGPPADLEGFLDFEMSYGGIRGLAVAITTPDATVLTIARGEASEGVPVDEHTLFILGSVSKSFAAMLVLQLVDDGLLDLDAPVDDYLPFAVRNPDFPAVPVTTRMLLTHTSGLTDDYAALGAVTTAGIDPTASLADFSRDYVADPAHWTREPGTNYSYCNACYGMLGYLVEVVAAEDFRTRSAARLLDPLALDGAGWFLADVDIARVATPYAFNSRRREFTPLPHAGYGFYPACSMRASVDGMARWTRVLARSGELDGMRVLSDAESTDMRTPPFPALARSRALGLELSTFHGRRWVGHTGEVNGGSTRFLVGEDGVSLVILTNSDAYIRSEIGQTEGTDAIRAILERLDTEADTLAR